MKLWRSWFCIAAAPLCLAAASPGDGERLVDHSMLARQARLSGDNKGWLEHGERVLRFAPDHPDLLISVSRARAANGRFDDSWTSLENAVRRGAGFDLSTFPEFKSAADSARLRAIRDAALQNMAPVSAPEVVIEVPDASLRPEGITWDPVGRHLYIGSIAGEIWRVHLDGRLERFAGPGSGLREVLGLKVDAERRLLWAVTGVFPDLFVTEPKKDVGIAGLHAYRLDTGERARECNLDERPTLHGFNDMALTRGGEVYVSDSSASAIYKLPANGCKFERVMYDTAVSFPNGIVLAPDESRLYVAHVEGISAVDLRTGKRTRLAVPANGAVNSIDGLAWDGGDLLGIQPSPYLARAARIRLAPDGLSIVEVGTLSSRPPLGLNPSTGVVVNDDFYMVAGVPDAFTTPAGQARPRARILRTPLNPRQNR